MDAPRILILEPDAAACDVLAMTLTDAGFTPDPVGTAQEALLAIRRSTPDLIVTELRLPDAPALTLLADLRQQPKLAETPMIALTDQPASLAVDHAARLRIDHIIAKPFSPRAVARTIAALLAGFDPSSKTPTAASVTATPAPPAPHASGLTPYYAA